MVRLIYFVYYFLSVSALAFSIFLIGKMVEKGTFEFIIRVKGMLGNTIPILALIENGTKQDIFSILKAGVYDYLENVEDLQEYQKKIEEILLWVWYLKKYGSQKGCNDQ